MFPDLDLDNDDENQFLDASQVANLLNSKNQLV